MRNSAVCPSTVIPEAAGGVKAASEITGRKAEGKRMYEAERRPECSSENLTLPRHASVHVASRPAVPAVPVRLS